MNVTKMVSVVGVLVLAGCASEVDGASEKAAADESAIVYDTVVSRAPDGSYDTRQVPITLADRHAQEAARAAMAAPANGAAGEENVGTTAQALSVDTACGGASFWGYDGPNQTGNRICLSESAPLGSPSALASFCKTLQLTCSGEVLCHGVCVVNWSHHVQSFWGGAKEGYLGGTGWAQKVGAYERSNSFLPTAETLQLQCVNNVNYPCPG